MAFLDFIEIGKQKQMEEFGDSNLENDKQTRTQNPNEATKILTQTPLINLPRELRGDSSGLAGKLSEATLPNDVEDTFLPSDELLKRLQVLQNEELSKGIITI